MFKLYRELTAAQKIECYAHFCALYGVEHGKCYSNFAEYNRYMDICNYEFNPETGECLEDIEQEAV